MDNESKFQEVQIKRNLKSVEYKPSIQLKDDSVFFGEENLKKVKSFQK